MFENINLINIYISKQDIFTNFKWFERQLKKPLPEVN